MARKLLYILIVVAGVSLAAMPCVADEQTDRVAQEISETAMSPFCPGRTISSCPSPQARELRSQIHTWLEAGDSKEAVMTKLLTAYGEEVRGAPQQEGFGLVGWVIPPICILVGALIMLMKLRQMKRQNPATEKRVDSPTKALIDKELKARMS